jgi:phosphate transport system substrate-binding protein
VFVNKDNPLQGMSLDQVDALFSKTLRCGAAKEASVWGDLGLNGSWSTAPISLYGRNSASGTYMGGMVMYLTLNLRPRNH